MKQCYIWGTETLNQAQAEHFTAIILQLYKDGVRDFYLTTHNKFDLQVESLMRHLKHAKKDMRLFLVVPHRKVKFQIIPPSDFDGIYFPPLEDISSDQYWEHTKKTMIRNSQYTIVHVGNHIAQKQDLELSLNTTRSILVI